MRKHIILAAVAAIGALVCSCEQEKDIKVPEAKSGEVSLVLAGVATRSAEAMPAVETHSYELDEVIDEDLKFSLEETVMDLGALVAETPETRGTPAYTENVVSLYGSQFQGVIYGASNTVVATDGTFKVREDVTAKPFYRELGFDLFKKSDPATFFLRMPVTQSGVTNLAYDYNANSIEFDFEAQESANKQQDILFAARRIDEATYLSEYKSNGGAQVLFRHALTGVKFAIGNNDTDSDNRRPNGKVETFITKVEIVGLKDKGHAKFIPTGEGNVDVSTTYSSADSFTWTDVTGTTNTKKFSEVYGENDIWDFEKGDAVGAADSFYEGGQNNNLNKPDASKTFWFIPQKIDDNLVVTVTLKVWNGKTMGEEKTLVLKLGTLLKGTDKNANWKAGQLRTFTLKPNVVDVDIEDDVDGFVKDNVVITNTGNVDAYIRANIIANWWGTTDAGDEGAALGYKPNDAGTGPAIPLQYYEGWKLINATTDNYGGEFDTLPGQKWQLAKDGYYYYTEKVAPGKPTGSPLFKSYTNTDDNIPVIYYLSSTQGYQVFSNMKFVMDITVQAIEAKTDDYIQDWNDEAEITVVPVTRP